MSAGEGNFSQLRGGWGNTFVFPRRSLVRMAAHTITAYHRLRGSASPVITATHHSYESLAWLSDFFPAHPWRSDPEHKKIHAKWLRGREFTQGCAFCSKNRYLLYSLISRAPKRSKFRTEIFRSIWPLTLEDQRENTPYSSSEPNESDIANRQSGGEKLKYVLKFYIGVHITWYRACAMTIQHCFYEHMMYGAEYLGNR